MTHAGRARGTGHVQAVTVARQRAALTRWRGMLNAAQKDHTHLWTATILHTVTPPLDGVTLDADSIILPPMVSCFVCEQIWEADLTDTRCPGDPQGRTI